MLVVSAQSWQPAANTRYHMNMSWTHLGVSRRSEAPRGVRGWRPPGGAPGTLPARRIPYWTLITSELWSFLWRREWRGKTKKRLFYLLKFKLPHALMLSRSTDLKQEQTMNPLPSYWKPAGLIHPLLYRLTEACHVRSSTILQTETKQKHLAQEELLLEPGS